MYSYNTRISFSESDENLELKIPALLNFFQDAAIFEAEERQHQYGISPGEAPGMAAWFLADCD